MLFTVVTTLPPAIEIFCDSSDKPNTSDVPKNCKVDNEVSVNIRVSCLVFIPATILEPVLTLKKPAVLVAVGCHTSGSGPTVASTFAHLINRGS